MAKLSLNSVPGRVYDLHVVKFFVYDCNTDHNNVILLCPMTSNPESADKTQQRKTMRYHWQMEESMCMSFLLGRHIHQRDPWRSEIG